LGFRAVFCVPPEPKLSILTSTCGKRNIRISWVFVFSMLLLNYLGQAAYCLNLPAGYKTDSIFYDMVPKGFLIPAIIVAAVSTTIAKSALMTGIFYTGERGD
jgi:KUP system potassium uptake protein